MFGSRSTHDPKTDHFSVKVLVFFALLLAVGTLGAFGAFGKADSDPVKVSTFEGCDLYEFTRNGKVGYVARCNDTGMVATTDANGNVVVTMP